jgi:hypothetical protein
MDDMAGIVENQNIRNFTLSVGKINIKNLVNTSIYKAFGINKAAFHVASLFIHYVNGILVYFIFKELFNRRVAVLSSVFFSLHPVTAEAVNWLSGSVYLYSALFNLLILYTFTKYKKSNRAAYYSISLVLMFVYYILLGTPWMIVTPVLLVTFDLFIVKTTIKTSSLLKLLPFFIPVLFLFLFKFGSQVELRNQRMSQEFIGTTEVSIPIKLGRNIMKTYQLMVFPYKLSITNNISEPSAFSYLLTIGAFILLIYLLYFSRKENEKIFGLILCIFIAAAPLFAPFHIAVNFAERYFYFSAVYYCGILSYLLLKWKKKFQIRKENYLTVVFLIIFLFGLRSFLRTFDWRNDESLWLSAQAATPNNYKVYNELGNVYYRRDDIREALANYEKALEIRPVYPIVYHNVGLAFLKAGQLDLAQQYFALSLKQDPLLAQSYYRLGQIFKLQGDLETAKNYFERSLQIDPSFLPAKKELNSL